MADLGSASPAEKRSLPKRPDGAEWHPFAVEAWDLAWSSPMAGQYTDSDVPGLLVFADLTHSYWTRPSVKTAAELRQARAAFGLSPIDRRRLGWKIEPVKPEATSVAQPTRVRDPRLRAVS